MPRKSTRLKACARFRRWPHGIAVSAVALATAVMPAAGAAATASSWPEEHINPAPAADDVILPMPCGGAMAFRKVVIPSEGPLSDRPITIGGADDTRGFAEGTRPAFIAGSFESEGEGRYYLLGKYEVTQLQYQALESSCPQPSPELRLPQTDIGWFDAVRFADRYSVWLRQNAADTLPKDGSELGFVRLPTEVEWEFAARGGINVSESEFTEPLFPMPDGAMVDYVWFAGSASSNNQVQRIGLLQANPLGLHDILGNVDEMTFDLFRLNRLDRLHGQAGGFVVRGGNFTTAEPDVRTAYRHEVPFYQGGEQRRIKTTGFRLAVVAPVITSRDRLREIEDEWAMLGTAPEDPIAGETAAETPRENPVQQLGAIADETADAEMQKRLKTLELDLRASFQARDEQRDRAAKARLRLGAFLCQKLKDDGIPVDRMKEAYKACAEARGADHERCVGQNTLIQEEEAKQYENVRYYADTIVTLTDDYGTDVVDQQAAALKGELSARGLQGLTPVVDTYAEHAADYRREKTIKRAEWLQECKTGGGVKQ